MVPDALTVEPWRAALAAELAAYAGTAGLDVAEATMAREYAPFIAAHADCLWRTCLVGHLTASAWVVDAARHQVLLTHHRKLGRWLQLGGHVDGNADLLAAAQREAVEESGLGSVAAVSRAIFDVDRHAIPARGAEPGHWHYDVRYLFVADAGEPLVVSDESHELAWVDLAGVAALNPSESMARMVRKTRAVPA